MPEFKDVKVMVMDLDDQPLKEYGIHKHERTGLITCFIQSKNGKILPSSSLSFYITSPKGSTLSVSMHINNIRSPFLEYATDSRSTTRADIRFQIGIVPTLPFPVHAKDSDDSDAAMSEGQCTWTP